MSSSDEEEQTIVDGDSCDANEIASLFKLACNISSEEAISLKKSYILHLNNSSDFNRIAAANQTNKSIHIYDLSNTSGLTQFRQVECGKVNAVDRDEICGVKFANENSNIIYVATVDGSIVLYDLRDTADTVQTFQCDPVRKKPLICFDVNVNDTVICAGTEESSCEAHLLFFDVRKNAMLGAYTDSHKDDVTQVKFHPSKHNILSSGSTDGLINVFNIVESSEDDALEYCLNTESSVQTLNWHPTEQAEANRLACITHTNDFHLFNVEESESIYQCTRDDVTTFIKRKLSSDCYLVNTYTTAGGDLVLLAGSNFNRGECLRSLTFNQNTFVARTDFSKNNKQIVRCSLYDSKNDTLITAGEGGIITVWESKQQAVNVSSDLKEGKKHKDRKVKPY